jgi:RimJ/RimL family protein N-acetyltransferase
MTELQRRWRSQAASSSQACTSGSARTDARSGRLAAWGFKSKGKTMTSETDMTGRDDASAGGALSRQALDNEQMFARVCSSQHICDFIELALGFSPRSFPKRGIEFRETPVRLDQPTDRMMLRRIGSAALATGIPRVLDAIGPVVRSMTLAELFSPLGVLELQRAMRPGEADNLGQTFHYTMIDQREFRPWPGQERATCLLPSDFTVQRQDTDAFAVIEDGERVAITSICSPLPHYIYIGVDTVEKRRQRGYGLAVVSATTDWILRQGAVAHYNTKLTNVASLRLARRLGFVLTSEVIGC